MKEQRRNEILVKRIAERLKELRKERNLTQENVRFDLELNIGRIEAAQHSITFSTLGDLCDYYGVTLEEFFRGIHTK
ncbi:helix-turn-helix domain-containing protein [Rikenella microfusus]|uniref:Helix-turn-helix domain n=1 Tax=Rikenella microfusus TaxID=28139 RepID=A0A379MQ61_9BACT|nr:helix-turn-helix transcriptional regulator [Rikenella microfusus]SUE33864.1 Helix-turn-helix domain [Rikenella microfusus]